jgi:lysozyme
MKTSDKGLALIQSSEGFEPKPYLCPAGKWTLGYGSTFYADGTAVKDGDQPVTEAQALELLRNTLGQYEDAVARAVTVALTQGQFDALVDFAYNVGCANFRTSTLLRKLNEGNYTAAALQFERWVHGGGKVLPGLVKRRAAERDLFLGRA